MQIHCPYTVIIGFITTIFATEKMYFLIAITTFSMAAFRTSLACIRRINLFYKPVMF